jgi:hypothetical protein
LGVDRLAVDFFAVDFRVPARFLAVERFVVAFFAADFRFAVAFFAADFRFAVAFFAADFRFAVAFFAADFRVAADFFTAVLRFAADFLAPDFRVAADLFAVDFRVVRFAVDFLAPARLAVDFFAPDRFAVDLLAVVFLPVDVRVVRFAGVPVRLAVLRRVDFFAGELETPTSSGAGATPSSAGSFIPMCEPIGGSSEGVMPPHPPTSPPVSRSGSLPDSPGRPHISVSRVDMQPSLLRVSSASTVDYDEASGVRARGWPPKPARSPQPPGRVVREDVGDLAAGDPALHPAPGSGVVQVAVMRLECRAQIRR